MTIENETSIKISNEQLLYDISLTHREQDAYTKIMDGLITLSTLPENIQTGKKYQYEVEFMKYSVLSSHCQDFLEKLYQLKAERGL